MTRIALPQGWELRAEIYVRMCCVVVGDGARTTGVERGAEACRRRGGLTELRFEPRYAVDELPIQLCLLLSVDDRLLAIFRQKRVGSGATADDRKRA